MDSNTPPIETLPRFAPYADDGARAPWHQSVRARVFAVTFSLTLAAGVLWTLLQPVVYQSSATVLMSAPSAIDATVAEANVQSVAIERRILLGREVTQALLTELNEKARTTFDLHYLREVLRVEPVSDTNLVEMIGQGEDNQLLPMLVNTWIDVYLDIRANNVQLNQQQTLEVVEDQLGGLDLRLEEAREALATYRQENDITSAERQENEELARLEGLNSALNSAVEAEVTARADMESLRSAIAAGKNVVPPSERESVGKMEQELLKLETQLSNLTKNYTMDYIRKQPRTRDIPERIAQLEEELEEVLAEGQDLILTRAEQAHSAALQTAQDLRRKLDAQKQDAARFTTIYAKHQALAEDLAELEALNREIQSRLVQVQVNQVEKYPQVSVIDRPAQASLRIGPNYLILLGVSAAAALVVGVLSVWLYGFLGPRNAKPAFVTLSGVHMYPQDVSGQLAYTPQTDPRLSASNTPLLNREDPEEPSEEPDDRPDDRKTPEEDTPSDPDAR